MQLSPLIQYLVEGTLPSTRSERAHLRRICHAYYIDDKGILRKIVPRKHKGMDNPAVLPKALWDQTIKVYHDDPLQGAHRKKGRLIKALKRNYVWDGMDLYVTTYCKTCPECQVSTVRNRNTTPLKPIVASYPGVLIQLDCTHGGPETDRGNKAILTIIESFSGHIRLYPIEDLTAKTIAKRILSYIAIHSMPLKIITDNGSEFRNQLITELRELLGFSHSRIAPYNSKANGKAENAHRTVQTMVRAYMDKYRKDWDLLLPLLEFAYNALPSASNGDYTPFYLHFGRHPILPLDAYYDTADRPILSRDEYIRTLTVERDSVISWVGKYKTEQAKKMAEKYNNDHKNTMAKFKVGDMVRVKNEQRRGANGKKYNLTYSSDLYRVTKIISDASTQIEKVGKDEASLVKNNKSLIKVLIRNELNLDMGRKKITQAETFEDKPEEVHTPLEDDVDMDDNEDDPEVTYGSWYVEDILDERVVDGKSQFLVKWEGYTHKENTWEPLEHIHRTDPEGIDEFITKMRARKAKKTKKKPAKKKK